MPPVAVTGVNGVAAVASVKVVVGTATVVVGPTVPPNPPPVAVPELSEYESPDRESVAEYERREPLGLAVVSREQEAPSASATVARVVPEPPTVPPVQTTAKLATTLPPVSQVIFAGLPLPAGRSMSGSMTKKPVPPITGKGNVSYLPTISFEGPHEPGMPKTALT
jgi:hypothetical protein